MKNFFKLFFTSFSFLLLVVVVLQAVVWSGFAIREIMKNGDIYFMDNFLFIAFPLLALIDLLFFFVVKTYQKKLARIGIIINLIALFISFVLYLSFF